MWQDSRALGLVTVTWELFKTAFVERFFPREMRGDKSDKFINLKQGSMTFNEYSLKFVKLSRYATSLLSYCRDEMSRFFTGIDKDLKEECRAAVLHDSMDLSRTMIHFHHVDERRKRKHSRVGNRSRQAEENFSRKCSTEITDKTWFMKGISNQEESSSSNGRYDKDFKPRVKRNNREDTPQERPPCRKCGKLHG